MSLSCVRGALKSGVVSQWLSADQRAIVDYGIATIEGAAEQVNA
jgi:hypothetical protein